MPTRRFRVDPVFLLLPLCSLSLPVSHPRSTSFVTSRLWRVERLPSKTRTGFSASRREGHSVPEGYEEPPRECSSLAVCRPNGTKFLRCQSLSRSRSGSMIGLDFFQTLAFGFGKHGWSDKQSDARPVESRMVNCGAWPRRSTDRTFAF